MRSLSGRWVGLRQVGRGLLAVSCLFVASACVAQQVYKWTDATGTIHYSEQPPPGDVKSERMTLAGATAGTPTIAEATAAADEVADSKALEKASDAQEERMCSIARQNLALLDSDARIASGSDVTTATQVIGEEREKARDEARSQIERYCHEQ